MIRQFLQKLSPNERPGGNFKDFYDKVTPLKVNQKLRSLSQTARSRYKTLICVNTFVAEGEAEEAYAIPLFSLHDSNNIQWFIASDNNNSSRVEHNAFFLHRSALLTHTDNWVNHQQNPKNTRWLQIPRNRDIAIGCRFSRKSYFVKSVELHLLQKITTLDTFSMLLKVMALDKI